MRVLPTALSLVILMGMGATLVRADGTLPPLPYRYVHPPPANKTGNYRPLSGYRVLPVTYMKSARWSMFTDDGQAGLVAPKGSFSVSPGTKAVLVRVEPVSPTVSLPPDVALDGNVYRMQATEQPGGRPAVLTKPLLLTMRWPKMPVGIMTSLDGPWHSLCYSDRAVFSPSTIACRTSKLGFFAVVTIAPTTGAKTSATTTQSTPSSSQNWYIIALITILVVLATAILALVFFRSLRRTEGPPR